MRLISIINISYLIMLSIIVSIKVTFTVQPEFFEIIF